MAIPPALERARSVLDRIPPEDITIRPLTQQDWPQLRSVQCRAAIGDTAALGANPRAATLRSPAWWRMEAARWALSPRQETFLAYNGDHPVGFIAIGTPETILPSPRRSGELMLFWVDREWRHSGVGSALISTAANWAIERRITRLSCRVRSDNAAAIELYEAKGMRQPRLRLGHGVSAGYTRMVINIRGLVNAGQSSASAPSVPPASAPTLD